VSSDVSFSELFPHAELVDVTGGIADPGNVGYSCARPAGAGSNDGKALLCPPLPPPPLATGGPALPAPEFPPLPAQSPLRILTGVEAPGRAGKKAALVGPLAAER